MQVNKIICGDTPKILKIFPRNFIDLIITSPPFWNARNYDEDNQIGYQQTYAEYLISLNKVWTECCRILVPGGRIVLNIGEIFFRLPQENYAIYTGIFLDIFQQFRVLTNMRFCGKILWCKGSSLENSGVKSGKPLFGSYPFPPNLLLSNCQENLMVWRKKGTKTAQQQEKKLAFRSKVSKDFMHQFTRPIWFIKPIRNQKHPAIFPSEIPYRFIKAYSFIKDIVLDPFSGIGTSCCEAKRLGRRYFGIDISEKYCRVAKQKLNKI